MSRSYGLLNRYITRELVQNFLVSFLFFFCIFFVNSILLLVQRILLKNINFLSMLEMVALSMPQFLVYTFPFATLTASSMVLGDLSSTNELLAIRSCGISARHIYRPLIIFSILMSFVTFIFADVVHPWSSVVYRDKLAELMTEMPTFEIEDNSVNSIGDIILYNGQSDGTDIYDLLLINKGSDNMAETIISEKGSLNLIDPSNYVYSLELIKPEIFLTDQNNIDTYVLSEAEKATIFLDFSNQIPSLTTTSPVNLTSTELIESIKTRDVTQKEDRTRYTEDLERNLLKFSTLLKDLRDEKTSIERAEADASSANFELEMIGTLPVNYTNQYYKSELTKKFALSSACFFLTLITLPLSNIRVRHGKLTGFALSLLVAVAYWYMLFGAQLFIFEIKSSPYLLIMSPNLLILFVAIVCIIYFRKAR